MSTKTLAVETSVYEQLASIKRRDESFSKAIDRLLEELEAAHTGSEILRGLAAVAPLSQEDAEVFLDVAAANRTSERWNERDLH